MDEFLQGHILTLLHGPVRIRLVPGGAERQDSVFNGLQAAGDGPGVVVIHDGVRPFVSARQIAACAENALKYGACILGIPAQDTLKRTDAHGDIRETVKRDWLWLAQTPQAFRIDLIKSAHEAARSNGVSGTDDAFLVEQIGIPVKMIKGSPLNIKITTEDDLLLAEAILNSRSPF